MIQQERLPAPYIQRLPMNTRKSGSRQALTTQEPEILHAPISKKLLQNLKRAVLLLQHPAVWLPYNWYAIFSDPMMKYWSVSTCTEGHSGYLIFINPNKIGRASCRERV